MSKFTATFAIIGAVIGFGIVSYHNSQAMPWDSHYTAFGYFVFIVGGFILGWFFAVILNILTAIEKRADRYMEKQNRAE